MQVPPDGAVQVEGDGDEGEHKGLPGCRSGPPGAAGQGTPHPWQESGLALTARFGEARSAKDSFPGSGRNAGPPLSAGFAIAGSGLADLAEIVITRAGLRAHVRLRRHCRAMQAHIGRMLGLRGC